MRSTMVSLVLVVVVFPLSLFARQHTKPASLNRTQIEGRRIFNQRCGVCHATAFLGAKRYATALNQEVVDGHEKAMAEIIRNGVPEMMPGFRYTLTDREIDAMVDYLKTVPKQAKAASHGNGPNAID
ncbi:MAG TPA: cytochrome c [Candidatus Dormibacteraeota bacterium]|nr:cytochrome c [Candidatus Dormibacteraeota bacterium]